ncbi:MAG TPA: alpha/beta hydrolase-fold protein [Bryobacteraceae bacterium]|nr:alpha/beta hydrolase-fold protein [Bryobacteraceae bacterium]
MRPILVCLFLSLAVMAQREPLVFDIQWVNPPKDPPKGVTHHVFPSASMKKDVGYNIYLPAEYETATSKRFPVIYWLHGAGGHESQGLAQAALLDKAITAGLMPPTIMVIPNGGKRSEYKDWQDQNVMAETMIIKELIPLVDAKYRTLPAPYGRAIEGMSMGGNGSLKLALKYPEMFGSVLAIAGTYGRIRLDGYFFLGVQSDQQKWVSKLAQWYSADDDVFELAKKNYNRLGHLAIRLLIGTQDVSFPDSEKLHVHLRDLGVAHEYEILLGVSHNTTQYYDRAGIHGFQFQAAAFGRIK